MTDLKPNSRTKSKSDSKSSSEDDLFREAMGDVAPIKSEQRVVLKATQNDRVSLEVRRRAAVDLPAQNREALTGDYVKPLSSHDPLEFKRAGIQHGVYRNLRLGKYAIEARLDLHRMSIEHARFAVAQFIKDCVENDVRCALINHGKGNHGKGNHGRSNQRKDDLGESRPAVDDLAEAQPALLKSCVAHWLPQMEEVLAFHSAQKQHGGLGAAYVLLRKSDKKRQETLEQHQKRQ